MPNWCQNTVVVRGDNTNLSKFKEWLGNGEDLLSKIKPIPQQLVDTTATTLHTKESNAELAALQEKNLSELGVKDWYDWCYSNWGTKWDVDAEIDEGLHEDVVLSFESAWSPPQAAIREMASKFPELYVRHAYFEGGACFVGYDEIENGKVINEVYNEDFGSTEWKQLASDDWGWEPEESA